MYSFSYLEPVCCSMFSSNCCFLTCIQISQEVGQVVWYSHLFQNFPQFVVIYTVKGFGIINKAEVDAFLPLSCFFNDPTDVGNSISGSSAFSKSSLNIWKLTVHILLEPGLENFKYHFTSRWDECNCAVIWAFPDIAFPPYWNKNFSSPVATTEYSKFAGILSAALSQHHLLGFEIAQLGVPSPPLALFVVMLPKDHLTSHSRMSDSRWVGTPLLLSGSLRPFLYSCVYSCHLCLISSASVRAIPFLSFIVPIFAWNVPLVSLNFLEEISSLSHFIVFLYCFALITEEGFLISPCYSLELCIQMGISFLFPLLFASFHSYL